MFLTPRSVLSNDAEEPDPPAPRATPSLPPSLPLNLFTIVTGQEEPWLGHKLHETRISVTVENIHGFLDRSRSHSRRVCVWEDGGVCISARRAMWFSAGGLLGSSEPCRSQWGQLIDVSVLPGWGHRLCHHDHCPPGCWPCAWHIACGQ